MLLVWSRFMGMKAIDHSLDDGIKRQILELLYLTVKDGLTLWNL